MKIVNNGKPINLSLGNGKKLCIAKGENDVNKEDWDVAQKLFAKTGIWKRFDFQKAPKPTPKPTPEPTPEPETKK